MDVLAQLRQLAELQTKIDTERDPLIVAARTQGHSWTVIGDAMGRTRQAAKNAYQKEQTRRGPAQIVTDG